jgi:hypothetical protein
VLVVWLFTYHLLSPSCGELLAMMMSIELNLLSYPSNQGSSLIGVFDVTASVE